MAESDLKRLAYWSCYPEPFASAHPERRRAAPKSKDAQDKIREGPRGEILRYAAQKQNAQLTSLPLDSSFRWNDEDDTPVIPGEQCETRNPGARCMEGNPVSSHGLTLLEVTVALALLGIFVGIALLALQPFLARSRVHTAARQVASDLQFARTKAIAQNCRFRITFRVATQDYIVDRDGDGTWERHLLHGHSTAEVENVTISLPPGVRITAVNSGSDIIFLPRGSVDGGITVTLGTSTGEAMKQVIVNLAGRVRIE